MSSVNPSAANSASKRQQPAVHVAWFAVLWFVWAALLAGAIVLGNREAGHGGIAASALRMGSSTVLAMTAWLGFAVWGSSAAGRFVLCVAIGMTLGTIGDFFNAGWLNFVPISDPVLGAIGAFAAGHIAYIVGCVDVAKRANLTDRRAVLGAIIAWQLVGLIGWFFIVMRGSEARALVWPALPYSLLLAGTAGITSGLALQTAKLMPLALGGALFLASDLILAFGMFRGHFAHQTEAVWLTYGPGQMLIVFSIISVVFLLRAPKASALQPSLPERVVKPSDPAQPLGSSQL